MVPGSPGLSARSTLALNPSGTSHSRQTLRSQPLVSPTSIPQGHDESCKRHFRLHTLTSNDPGLIYTRFHLGVCRIGSVLDGRARRPGRLHRRAHPRRAVAPALRALQREDTSKRDGDDHVRSADPAKRLDSGQVSAGPGSMASQWGMWGLRLECLDEVLVLVAEGECRGEVERGELVEGEVLERGEDVGSVD